MRAVEMFYTVDEAGLLLRLCTKTILQRLKAREFGANVVNLGSEVRPDYRIPASGINEYLSARRIFTEPPDPGTGAKSVGELRRKVADQAHSE